MTFSSTCCLGAYLLCWSPPCGCAPCFPSWPPCHRPCRGRPVSPVRMTVTAPPWDTSMAASSTGDPVLQSSSPSSCHQVPQLPRLPTAPLCSWGSWGLPCYRDVPPPPPAEGGGPVLPFLPAGALLLLPQQLLFIPAAKVLRGVVLSPVLPQPVEQQEVLHPPGVQDLGHRAVLL